MKNPQQPDLLAAAEALAQQRERLRQLGARPVWTQWELPGGAIVSEEAALEWLIEREGELKP